MNCLNFTSTGSSKRCRRPGWEIATLPFPLVMVMMTSGGKLSKPFADVFGAEDALVRPHISSGTHAISLALYGVLRPGDHLLAITGSPYDTIRTVIGLEETERSGNH